jgi:hypothetical protein
VTSWPGRVLRQVGIRFYDHVLAPATGLAPARSIW